MPSKKAKASPRRTPTKQARKYDPERTCRALLDAALDEFAAKGYGDARIQDIADRAGVNKQLISYYFGGKEGLYRGVLRERLARNADTAAHLPLADQLVAYLHDVLADPRPIRLLTWRSLSEEVPEHGAENDPAHGAVARMRQRQELGEFAADLDPGVLLIVLTAATAAPVTMAHRISRVLGMTPHSHEFATLYEDQLRKIVAYLTGPSAAFQAAEVSDPDCSCPDPAPGPERPGNS